MLLSKVNDAWDSKWFTNDGPIARELEKRLQNFLGVRHCVLASNGTAAMSTLVRALGLKGEVIIPSFTFISTAHTLSWAGIRPVFCDIDAETFNMDPGQCRDLITPETSAVIPTHVWGNAGNIEAFEDICRSAGLPLIFDAAHAFGCTYKAKPVGGFGNAEVFSFHATKVFHTFEGGAITTNDDLLAARLRKIRNFGFSDCDTVDMIGTNAKMSEIHAAMGLANLAEIDVIFNRCKEAFATYSERMGSLPGIEMRKPDPGERSNHQYVAASVDEEKFGLSRDDLLAILHVENVLARRYFYPGGHGSEPHRSLYPDAAATLPHSVEANGRVIVFPAGASIEVSDISKICDIVEFVSNNSEDIAHRMRGEHRRARS